MKAGEPLTVVAPIADGKRAELERVLGEIAADLRGNAVLVPGTLPATHFTRFVIVDDLLVWESNHDGDRGAYLAACAAAAPAGFDAIFGCCDGYPGTRDRDGFVRWAQRHHHRAGAFYRAYPGVTQAQVVNDARVHDAIRAYLDAHRVELFGLAPVEIQRRLAAHVRAQGLDGSRQGDRGAVIWLRQMGIYALAGVLGLILLVLLPISGPAAWLAWSELRKRERAEVPPKASRPVHDDDGHRRVEDQIRQNQLTHVVDVKPGKLRWFTLRFFLLLVDILARVWCVYGDLAGITSIHYARWVLVKHPKDGRDRLLFLSNYDGSWDSYLGEFIDRAAWGLTGVWSNTEGFPATRDLIREGALDEEAFKQWARDHQIPTQVWWSNVPTSTVQNVRDDVWIRRRLEAPLGDDELPVWLRKL